MKRSEYRLLGCDLSGNAYMERITVNTNGEEAVKAEKKIADALERLYGPEECLKGEYAREKEEKGTAFNPLYHMPGCCKNCDFRDICEKEAAGHAD